HPIDPPMDAQALADIAALDPALPDNIESTATALSPGASAALFIAARMALHDGKKGANAGQAHPFHERCELRPPLVDRATLPPDEAAARLRGAWWDDEREALRTDYPAPPGFDGEESDAIYDIDGYERDLTPQESEALAALDEAQRRPYEIAAALARDAFFGFTALEEAG
ncbi:hypothetical protein ACI3KQ_13225, partial [Sphingobium sp. ZW T5_29]